MGRAVCDLLLGEGRNLSSLLEVDAGMATIKIDRLYFTADGEMVELAVSYYNPWRYSYRVRLRRTLS